VIFGDEDGIVRVDPAIAAEVLVAVNEIRQMENGIFAGTLTPSMFDAAEARPCSSCGRTERGQCRSRITKRSIDFHKSPLATSALDAERLHARPPIA